MSGDFERHRSFSRYARPVEVLQMIFHNWRSSRGGSSYAGFVQLRAPLSRAHGLTQEEVAVVNDGRSQVATEPVSDAEQPGVRDYLFYLRRRLAISLVAAIACASACSYLSVQLVTAYSSGLPVTAVVTYLFVIMATFGLTIVGATSVVTNLHYRQRALAEGLPGWLDGDSEVNQDEKAKDKVETTPAQQAGHWRSRR